MTRIESPFKLLAPYSPQEKDIFFGRESEIFALYHLLKQTRIVLVYGASGTGKTSLIQAGLPKVFKISDWFRIPIRRKGNINQSLVDTLNRISKTPVEDLLTAIPTIYHQRWIPLYLVFDQFEEIFTLGDEAERVQFFTTLQKIIRTKLPCKVILSMREEYIGHLYEYEYLVPTLFQKRFRVEAMKDSTLKQVIQKMTASKGILLANQEETTEQILAQIKFGKQAAYLPYLQIYLHYLFEYSIKKGQQPIVFNQEGIKAIGALGNVLKTFINDKIKEAQNHLNQFGAAPRFAATLLDEFATSEGTKQSRLQSTLIEHLKGKTKLVTEALNYFSQEAKLLRADENDTNRYEPIHDVVAQQIHELRSPESKEYKTFERKLELDYKRWIKDQQVTARLLPELDLNKAAIFNELLEQKTDFTTKYQPFIQASIAHHKAAKKRKWWLNVFLWMLTIAALAGGIIAFINKSKADQALEDLKQKSKEFQQEQAEKVLLEVNNIEQRALEIKGSYPNTAKNMLKDAIDKLEAYPENQKLIEKAINLKKELGD